MCWYLKHNESLQIYTVFMFICIPEKDCIVCNEEKKIVKERERGREGGREREREREGERVKERE